MTPEQIAESEGYELSAVKSILYQHSALFREKAKTDTALDFTDSELDEANKAIVNIMRYSEDDNLRLRAALYLRDDKKGRRDQVNSMKGLNLNILQINQHLVQVAQQMADSRAKANGSIASTDKSVLGNIKESEEIEV